MAMKRRNLHLAIDAASLLVLLALVLSGIVLHSLLPPGSGGRGGGGGLSLWGASRHEWGELHFWFALAAVALMAVHVVLHWTWVCAAVRGLRAEGGPPARPGRRALAAYAVGFAAGLTLVVAGFWAFGSRAVTASGADGHGHRMGHGRGAAVGSHGERERAMSPPDGAAGVRLGARAGRGGGRRHRGGLDRP
jgi:hypothetical protein